MFVVIYYGLIKLSYGEIMETVLVPFFNLINVDKKIVSINHDLDDIIISSKIGDFPKVRYGLPFGPFYFLGFISCIS